MRNLDKLETLGSNLSYGSVFKKPIYEDQYNYIAILYVAPNSGVKDHFHLEDSEQYTNLDNGESETCAKGDHHSLDNTSKDKWLLVHARKYKY